MSTNKWDPRALPRAEGKTFVVTGGNAGIGYFITEQLATTGAHVILASRSRTKADLAISAVTARVRDARLSFIELDLSSLESVSQAAQAISDLQQIDGVVLNAGVLAQKVRQATTDGHDLVFGTNHLGNFSLIRHVLPALESTPGSRVVTVGSVAQKFGRLNPDDLEPAISVQSPFRTYASSKLAQMLTAIELQRRLEARSSATTRVLSHPGGAVDGLTPTRAPVVTRSSSQRIMGILSLPVAQGKDHAAWPTIRALLDPDVVGGELWGPRIAHTKGTPVREKLSGQLNNGQLSKALWTATEDLLASSAQRRNI